MDFEKSFLATYSVRGHFCHLLKAAPEHNKRRAELLFPFEEFWDPFALPIAQAEKQRPPISPGSGFVIQLIAMATGLHWGLYTQPLF